MSNNTEDNIKTVVSPDMTRKNRIPPGQWETSKFPVLHYGSVPRVDINKWKFTLTGLVENEKVLTFKDFQNLPKIRVKSDIHCVTTWSKLDTLWEGVSTSELKNLVHIKPEAKYAIVHAEQGFTTNLNLDDFFAEDVLLAFKYNNKPLTPEHGYPVRLVVPRLYFWKSAKWVIGVEFTTDERLGFWERNGYHHHGDPWKEERYS
jgi:DMSO/TMAO reductase YedYZ molybdopterin-dependent catalytic subunit